MTPEQHVAEAEALVRDVVEHGAPAGLLDYARAYIELAQIAAHAPELTR